MTKLKQMKPAPPAPVYEELHPGRRLMYQVALSTEEVTTIDDACALLGSNRGAFMRAAALAAAKKELAR